MRQAARYAAPFFMIGVRDFVFSRELETFLKEFPVGGIALFNSPHDTPSNIWKDPEGALEALYEFMVKAQAHVSLFACDQEGGRVRRLRAPFAYLPSAERISQAIDETGDWEALKKLWGASARQMALTKIHLNFAPVCDLRMKESSAVVGDRSFGSDGKKALPFVKTFCEVFESSDVHTTLKHFPGHGPTRFDSHEKIALLFKDRRSFENEDLPIFFEAAPSASAILTAHLAFEEEPERIFSLDKKFLETYRRKLPSSLAWITDDLQTMKAVSDRHPWTAAFDCLYDIILVCGTLEQSGIALEETTRHLEKTIQNYAQEDALERRIKRAQGFFRSPSTLLPFAEWREKIYQEQEIAFDALESLKIQIPQG